VKRLVELALTLREMGQVLRMLPRVESARRRLGPRAAVAAMRRQGQDAAERDERGRRCLRRAIRWVDLCLAGGNCYRRSLLEIALDRSAASAPLVLGFNVRAERLDGHAWVGTGADNPSDYQFTVRV
jgi:hypothetical protein